MNDNTVNQFPDELEGDEKKIKSFVEMTPNERLRHVRSRIMAHQQDMARAVGFSQSAYSQMESGVNRISKRLKLLLAAKYRINPEWLDTGEGPIFIQKGKAMPGVPDDETFVESDYMKMQKKVEELTEEIMRYRRIIDKLTKD